MKNTRIFKCITKKAKRKLTMK